MELQGPALKKHTHHRDVYGPHLHLAMECPRSALTALAVTIEQGT